MSIRGVQNTNTPQPELQRAQRPETIPERDKPGEGSAEPISHDAPMPRDEYIPSRRAALMSRAAPEKPSIPEPETCTVDITEVNREIKELRDQKAELEQQARSASNPEEAEKLSRKLAQVESRLLQKDNDTYRRQNADVTYS